MADIFISYASEDREKARQIGSALEAQGWSVWWDRTIPAGRNFAEVIDEALREARCILALWSSVSVQKNWVLEEAEDGLARKILVPVFVEQVELPRGFRRIQAANLSDWDGSEASEAFRQLVADVAQMLGPPPAKETPAAQEQEDERTRRAAEATREAEQQTARQAEEQQAPRDEERGREKLDTGAKQEAEEQLQRAQQARNQKEAAEPHKPGAKKSVRKVPTLWAGIGLAVLVAVALITWQVQHQADLDWRSLEATAKKQQLAEEARRKKEEEALRAKAEAARAEQQRLAEEARKAGKRAEEKRQEEIRARQRAAAREPGDIFQDPLKGGAAGPRMVVIEAGPFTMGSPDKEHQGRIGKRFAMSVHEVTVGEFQTFATAREYRTEAEQGNGCRYRDETDKKWKTGAGNNWRSPGFKQGASHPVVCISLYDAQQYVKWLSKETGERYRLPSEAEWEFAARASKQAKFSFGDDEAMLGDYAWFTKNSNSRTHPVGTRRPNSWGLHDMHGNVWEWTADCWHESFSGAPRDGTAWTNNCEAANKQPAQVIRGGSWDSEAKYARSASRIAHDRIGERKAVYDLGFRIARDL